MTPLTQQLEDKKKGCDVDIGGVPCGEFISHTEDEDGREWGKTYYCKHCNEIIAILEQAIAEMKKQRQEISKSLRERIMRNGNLSNRIIENNYGEFEHKHDYVLNEIVCEIIEETLQQLNQPKTEKENLNAK